MPEHLKVSKLGLWWDPLIQSRKVSVYVPWIEGAYVPWRMIQNLEMNWLVDSKFPRQILTQALQSLKNLQFNGLMGSFWPKYIIFELKNYRGVILIALEIGAKFERKVADAFKNNMRNFANFHRLKNSDLILES